MRAAAMTSNLAANQLVKHNKKSRETLGASVASAAQPAAGHVASTNSNTRTNEDDHQALRNAKLRDMSREEIGLESMRKLFRLLDADGGGALDAAELKRGMTMLGFEETENPLALDRLLREIDQDKTGTIEESEFLAYLSQHTRASLKQKLPSWCLNYTHIQATRYGSVGKPVVEVAEIQASSLGHWITEVLTTAEDAPKNYWIEVTGYDCETFTAMAEALGFTHNDLVDMLRVQEPKVGMLKGSHGTGASIIMPNAKMSFDPVQSRSGSRLGSFVPRPVAMLYGILFGYHSGALPNYLKSKRMVSKSAIAGITISLEQASILVANKSMVFTFRLPVNDYEAGELAGHAKHSYLQMPIVWSPYIGTKMRRGRSLANLAKPSAVWSDVSPYVLEKSEVRLVFEGLRGKLAGHFPSVSATQNSDVRTLAVFIVDSLLTSNYHIRDRMQDWEELVEASIVAVDSSTHIHLEAIGTLLNGFIAHLQRVANVLQPGGWGDQKAEAEGGGEEKEAGGGEEVGGGEEQECARENPKRLGAPPAVIPIDAVAANGEEGHQEGGTPVQNFGARPPIPGEQDGEEMDEVNCETGGVFLGTPRMFHGRYTSRAGLTAMTQEMLDEASQEMLDEASQEMLDGFFAAQIGFFTEMANDMSCLVRGMQEGHERVANLTRRLNTAKQDMMNKTLFALTLVTAITTPIMICTGLYGMNFADMPELDPTLPGGEGFGYQYFWRLVGSIVGCTLLILLRLGLFRTLL